MTIGEINTRLRDVLWTLRRQTPTLSSLIDSVYPAVAFGRTVCLDPCLSDFPIPKAAAAFFVYRDTGRGFHVLMKAIRTLEDNARQNCA